MARPMTRFEAGSPDSDPKRLRHKYITEQQRFSTDGSPVAPDLFTNWMVYTGSDVTYLTDPFEPVELGDLLGERVPELVPPVRNHDLSACDATSVADSDVPDIVPTSDDSLYDDTDGVKFREYRELAEDYRNNVTLESRAEKARRQADENRIRALEDA